MAQTPDTRLVDAVRDAARQFDALIHIDRTSAVEPLERTPIWESAEAAETYPTGV